MDEEATDEEATGEEPMDEGLGNLTRYRAAERTDSVQQSSQ